MGRADTVWVEVAVLRRSRYGDGWEVEAEDGTKAWVSDTAIIDSEEDLAIGASTKIELATGYAEDKGLA